MKATSHGPHLIKLTRARWVNCYLVRDDDGLTLVDSTLGGAAGDILAAARDAGGEIGRIALTHAHRLRGLEPSQLAVGHGRVLEAPLEDMDRAIAHAGG